MHHRFVTYAALAMLAPSFACAQETTAFSFLRSDVGARAAALAGSVVSLTNDPASLFVNPASLGTLESPAGAAGFFKHLLDINAGYAVYGQALEGIGAVGAGVIYTNYGSFDRMDEFGNATGTFTAQDMALSLGYSNQLQENLTYGAALKFIYSSIAGYTSTAAAADAGILYRIPESRLALGASIRNMGRMISTYAGVTEPLPLDIAVGASIVPRGLPLLLNVNFHRLNENPGSFIDRFGAFTVGGEFTLSRVFRARFGYDNRSRQDLQTGTTAGLAGFSAGVGITVAAYQVDYALSSLGAIGNLHRVSVGMTL
ncbi:MAG TPA: type IX secretion system protein PorQ [Bacteroidota bacterium]|nr:type IX secretion system protein PorQ [Bacteroidota bacterium]